MSWPQGRDLRPTSTKQAAGCRPCWSAHTVFARQQYGCHLTGVMGGLPVPYAGGIRSADAACIASHSTTASTHRPCCSRAGGKRPTAEDESEAVRQRMPPQMPSPSSWMSPQGERDGRPPHALSPTRRSHLSQPPICTSLTLRVTLRHHRSAAHVSRSPAANRWQCVQKHNSSTDGGSRKPVSRSIGRNLAIGGSRSHESMSDSTALPLRRHQNPTGC